MVLGFARRRRPRPLRILSLGSPFRLCPSVGLSACQRMPPGRESIAGLTIGVVLRPSAQELRSVRLGSSMGRKFGILIGPCSFLLARIPWAYALSTLRWVSHRSPVRTRASSRCWMRYYLGSRTTAAFLATVLTLSLIHISEPTRQA